MFGLFVAVPFGTLAYLAIGGGFDRGKAAVTLGVLLTLKIAFGVLRVLAHQCFLLNKGLIALLLASVIGTVLLGFLHGLVPGVMVSIVDPLGAVIIAILRDLSRRSKRRRLAAPPSSVGTAGSAAARVRSDPVAPQHRAGRPPVRGGRPTGSAARSRRLFHGP